MKTQEIIDKHLKEFHEVQRLKVPIELNSYLQRMIEEALRIYDIIGRSEQLPFSFIEWYSGMERQKILNAYERWKREKGN
jgi:hypothetical protein